MHPTYLPPIGVRFKKPHSLHNPAEGIERLSASNRTPRAINRNLILNLIIYQLVYLPRRELKSELPV